MENTLLKTEQDKIEFLVFVGFLMANVLPQGRLLLQTEAGYCCLGFGCILLIPEDQLRTNKSTNRLAGALVDSQPAAPNWLRDLNGNFESKNGKSLTQYNDDIRYSFPQIGQLLLDTYTEELNNPIS